MKTGGENPSFILITPSRTLFPSSSLHPSPSPVGATLVVARYIRLTD